MSASRMLVVVGALAWGADATAQQSHVLVLRGGDTTRLDVQQVIEVARGEPVRLVARLFTGDGAPIDSTWWHNTSPEFVDLDVDGKLRGTDVGVADVMLHWLEGFHWVAIRVNAPPEGRMQPPATGPPFESLLVTPEWLAAHLDDPSLVILHVDDEGLYDRGHIPGARFVGHMAVVTDRPGASHVVPTLDDVRFVLEELGISDDSRVVIYGQTLSATRMFWTLEYAGLTGRVAILGGGLEGWRAAGHPMSDQRPRYARGVRSGEPNQGAHVTAAWVLDHLGDPEVLLIDARPPDEVAVGFIPGARHLHWRDMMTDAARTTFKPESELRALFTAAGYRAGRRVVTYCQIGLRASATYFVARLLGYDVGMFDGSWNEWSRMEGALVAR